MTCSSTPSLLHSVEGPRAVLDAVQNTATWYAAERESIAQSRRSEKGQGNKRQLNVAFISCLSDKPGFIGSYKEEAESYSFIKAPSGLKIK